MIRVSLSVPAVLSVCAGLTSFVLGRWVWEIRERPGAVYWTGVQIVVGGWALSYGVALLFFDPQIRRLFEPLLWLFRDLTPPLVLLFALKYTGRDRIARPEVAAGLLGFWLFAVLFYIGNLLGVHSLAWRSYQVDPVFGAAAVDFIPGPGLYLFAGFAYICNGTAALLVLGPLLNYRQLFGRQTLTITLVVLLPTITNIVWLFRLGPTAHLDLTPVVLLLSFLGIFYALFRESMFELLPATTRVANDIALDDIDTAVVTVSPSGRLISLNSAGATLFGIDARDAVGEPLSGLLDVDIPLEETEFTVTDPAGQNRKFDVTVSPLTSSADDPLGYIVTFYDITAERQRQQRLAVQNRILRHNLRNSLTVIQGNVDRLADLTTEDAVKTLTADIRDTAETLLTVSEKARQFDTALSADATTLPVESISRDVIETVREQYPGATITFEPDATPEIHGSNRLFRQVLGEILENAVVHSEQTEPQATVRLTVTQAEKMQLSVEDNGPGIPRNELAAIDDGDENPLQHGSGIGLWMIEWGVSSLGGTVEFERTGTGTRVTVTVPCEPS